MARRGLNKVMIIGSLERAPEMRHTPSGRAVTNFSVATTHEWMSAEGIRREETEWFNVVAWGELAKKCFQHLDRGTEVYVEGRLKTRSWEDANGKRHFRTEIVAKDMIPMDLAKDEDTSSYPRYRYDDEKDEYDF